MMSVTIVTEKQQESKVLALVTYEDSFRGWLEEKDYSDCSVRLYLNGLNDFRQWFEDNRGLSLEPTLIVPLAVKGYRRYLLEDRKLAPRSVNSYLAAVRSFCRWAMDAELLAGDPSSGIKGVKITDIAPRWLSQQEQYKILTAAQERVQIAELKAGDEVSTPGLLRARRDRAIIVLMLNTGLRLSEVAGLRTSDITVKPRSGSVKVVGKGQKARTVPLNKDAREALSAWVAVRPESEDDSLFTSQKGNGPLGARAIARRVEYIGKRAGVEITPHMLRHSLAKNMVDEGVSLDRVGMALGHASLDTTKRYTLPSEADMQSALERVAWSD
ncbi:MAG: tyrosine-type recombinase/integrase [Anaerolineae bacterium]|nr:tyrosine-type recombinase/integrase [Anaerolineae bacterium]